MEIWTAHDDERPSLRPEPPRSQWVWLAIGAAILAAMAGVYFYSLLDLRPAPPPAPVEVAAPAALAPSPPAPADGGVRHPLAEAEAAPSLPTLDNSDAMVRESLSGLIGGEAFQDLVIPKELVRRIVATVDNLPRQTAPRRAIPLTPVPGAFVPDASNEARYAPYVRVFESIDTGALVASYARAYPLFQRAYEELGFPGRYFNDRLIEAIDDLLAAPEPAAPVELVQSKVLYEFADPALEARSAGQKIMLRMGTPNALRVKVKLREIRREILAARERR